MKKEIFNSDELTLLESLEILGGLSDPNGETNNGCTYTCTNNGCTNNGCTTNGASVCGRADKNCPAQTKCSLS